MLQSMGHKDSDLTEQLNNNNNLGIAMTKLHNVLKSKGITLLTKVHIIKPMVFPAVMYRCESWTIKEH